MLVEAGERVGLPGLMRPTGSRAVIDRMAEAIVHDPTERASLPPAFAPAPLSEIVVLSDLWSPIEDIRATLTQLSSNGAHGHLVQIVDPAEETFPYSGRVEFIEPEGAGEITAGRAETWRADYEARLERHRDEIRAETDRLGWSFTIHRTDRPATELLLALHARIGEGNDAAIDQPPAARHGAREVRMMGLPLGFASAAGAARPAQPAGAVVAAAADAAAPAARRRSRRRGCCSTSSRRKRRRRARRGG